MGYVFIAPWLIGFLLLTIGPILYSAFMSFCDFKLLSSPVLSGLDNYRRLFFEDPIFIKALKNTMLYVFVAVPLQILLSLLFAALLNQQIHGQNVFRTLFFLPSILPEVASAIVWAFIFNPSFGLMNSFLRIFGIEGPMWLNSSDWAMFCVIIMSFWGIGGTIVIFLSSMQGIDSSLVEAAALDGASGFRTFMSVKLPLLSPITFFNLIMGFIGGFKVFTFSYVMTGGGPAFSTLTFALYIYKNAFEYFDMGYACAQSWILFAIIALFTSLVFRSSQFWVFYETQTVSKKERKHDS
ncbi:MAG: carbohydrate ABC transporter permease [Candidatus Excrementavichristensenella sp.]